MVLAFESVDKILKCVTIQMIATQQYLSVVQFIMLHKVISTCYSVDEFLQFAVEL